jgi:mRNA interferase RelE/StbE
MDAYQIEWKESALREIKRLDRKAIPRILAVVETLAPDPFPPGVRKLKGGQCTYRLRVGDYRIIYEVFESRLVIEIVRVRHRKDAYRE